MFGSIEDIIDDRIKVEKMEERRCPGNICQQEVRKENRAWKILGGRWKN